MYLLNSKSILDCVDIESEIHNQEIDDFMEHIYEFDNYECVLIINRIDLKCTNNNEVIKTCNLHQILSCIDCVDIKNGVDLCIKDGFIFFVCYGQEYILNGKHGIITHTIQILPFNYEREFVKLF